MEDTDATQLRKFILSIAAFFAVKIGVFMIIREIAKSMRNRDTTERY